MYIYTCSEYCKCDGVYDLHILYVHVYICYNMCVYIYTQYILYNISLYIHINSITYAIIYTSLMYTVLHYFIL